MGCVNVAHADFKKLASDNNVDSNTLELIVHKYWLEKSSEDDFPSNIYIQAQLGNVQYKEPIKAVRELWEMKYSHPETFSSMEELQQARQEALKYFPASAVSYYRDSKNAYTLVVKKPVASIKYGKDKTIEGNSLQHARKLDLGIQEGRAYSVDKVKELFDRFNTDRTTAHLAEKAFKLAEEVGLFFKFVNDMPKDASGRYASDGTITYSKAFFERMIGNNMKAPFLLHEILHAASVYALNAANESMLSKDLQKFKREINTVFSEVKANPALQEEVGIDTVEEFVAELSNPVFRKKLKEASKQENKSWWSKIVNAFKSLLGLRSSSDYYSRSMKALEKALEAFDVDAYMEYNGLKDNLEKAARAKRVFNRDMTEREMKDALKSYYLELLPMDNDITDLKEKRDKAQKAADKEKKVFLYADEHDDDGRLLEARVQQRIDNFNAHFGDVVKSINTRTNTYGGVYLSIDLKNDNELFQEKNKELFAQTDYIENMSKSDLVSELARIEQENNDYELVMTQTSAAAIERQENTETKENPEIPKWETGLPGKDTKIDVSSREYRMGMKDVRPFKLQNERTKMLTDDEIKFNSVAQALQFYKLTENYDNLSKVVFEGLAIDILEAAPTDAEAIGKRIMTPQGWETKQFEFLKELVKESYDQNPRASLRFLESGEAEITNTNGEGKWKTEYPRILSEVRSEIRKENRELTNQLDEQLKQEVLEPMGRTLKFEDDIARFFGERPNAMVQQANNFAENQTARQQANENAIEEFFISKKNREQYEESLRRTRPEMSEVEIQATLDFLHALRDNKENTEYIKTIMRWIQNGTFRFPQDTEVARQAISKAKAKNLDLSKYYNLRELIQAPEMQPKEREKQPFNPDEAKTFSNKRTVKTKDGRTLTVYDVENSPEGQREVVKAMAAHYEMSPWCLATFNQKGEPTPSAKRFWGDYDALPRKIAFENGKPVAFNSSETAEYGVSPRATELERQFNEQIQNTMDAATAALYDELSTLTDEANTAYHDYFSQAMTVDQMRARLQTIEDKNSDKAQKLKQQLDKAEQTLEEANKKQQHLRKEVTKKRNDITSVKREAKKQALDRIRNSETYKEYEELIHNPEKRVLKDTWWNLNDKSSSTLDNTNVNNPLISNPDVTQSIQRDEDRIKAEVNTYNAVSKVYPTYDYDYYDAKNFYKEIGHVPTREELSEYIKNRRTSEVAQSINSNREPFSAYTNMNFALSGTYHWDVTETANDVGPIGAEARVRDTIRLYVNSTFRWKLGELLDAIDYSKKPLIKGEAGAFEQDVLSNLVSTIAENYLMGTQEGRDIVLIRNDRDEQKVEKFAENYVKENPDLLEKVVENTYKRRERNAELAKFTEGIIDQLYPVGSEAEQLAAFNEMAYRNSQEFHRQWEWEQDENAEEDLPFYMTPQGLVYGFVDKAGDVYLDRNIISPQHPIHEYTHLWDRALQEKNPELWKRGVELMKQTSEWLRVETDANYGQKWKKKGISGERLENLIASEVHSRFVGEGGEVLMKKIAKKKGMQGIIAKLREWILEAWKSLGETFGYWSPEDLAKLTLKDFNHMTMRDFIMQGTTDNNGMFSRENDDIQAMMVGEKGARSLDAAEEATTRMDNLSVANEMEKAGKAPITIKVATGWERGADGKWRYEIPDVTLKQDTHNEYEIFKNIGNNKDSAIPRRLSEIIDFSSLPPAYRQELENAEIKIYNDSKDTEKGGYEPIGPNKVFSINIAGYQVPEYTIAHEIQHYIQEAEGFAKGGNPRTSLEAYMKQKGIYDTYSKLEKLANSKFRTLQKILYNDDLYLKYKSEGKEDLAEKRKAELEKEHAEELRKAEKRGAEAAVEIAKIEATLPSGYEAYQRLAGEVESRTASERVYLTMEERRNSLFTDDMYKDVAKEDLIFLQEGVEQGMQMSNTTDVAPIGNPLRRELHQLENKQRAITKEINAVWGQMKNYQEDGEINTPQGTIKVYRSINPDERDKITIQSGKSVFDTVSASFIANTKENLLGGSLLFPNEEHYSDDKNYNRIDNPIRSNHARILKAILKYFIDSKHPNPTSELHTYTIPKQYKEDGSDLPEAFKEQAKERTSLRWGKTALEETAHNLNEYKKHAVKNNFAARIETLSKILGKDVSDCFVLHKEGKKEWVTIDAKKLYDAIPAIGDLAEFDSIIEAIKNNETNKTNYSLRRDNLKRRYEELQKESNALDQQIAAKKEEIKKQEWEESELPFAMTPQEDFDDSYGMDDFQVSHGVTTPNTARETTVNSLRNWYKYQKKHISVNFSTNHHDYLIDGVLADYSVTEYKDLVYGKPTFWGDFRHSMAIGNDVDALTRDFFEGKVDVYSKTYGNLNVDRRNAVINDLKRLKAYFDKTFIDSEGKPDYKVITSEFRIAARIMTPNGEKTIAGTMDMVIVDGNGDIHILDMKAKRDQTIDSYNNRRDYTFQLNAYKQILEATFPEFKGKIKDLHLIWFDTTYPKNGNGVTFATDDNGMVTVTNMDTKEEKPLSEYERWVTPALKPNVEKSLVPLTVGDVLKGVKPIDEKWTESFAPTESNTNTQQPLTPDEVYTKLKEQYQENSPERKLLDIVFSALKIAGTKFVDTSIASKDGLTVTTGQFDPVENTIYYDKEHMIGNTLLHEAIHAVTSYYLRSADPSVFSKEINVAITEIHECWSLLKDDFIKNIIQPEEGETVSESVYRSWTTDEHYGLTSPTELVAEISNPELIKYIRDYDKRHKGKNIFQRLVNAIMNLFGVNKTYGSLEKTLKDALVTLITNPSKELMDRYSLEAKTFKENREKIIESASVKFEVGSSWASQNLLPQIKDNESNKNYADFDFVVSAEMLRSILHKEDGVTAPISESEVGTIITIPSSNVIMTINGKPRFSEKEATATIPLRIYNGNFLQLNTFDIKKGANGANYITNIKPLFNTPQIASQSTQKKSNTQQQAAQQHEAQRPRHLEYQDAARWLDEKLPNSDKTRMDQLIEDYLAKNGNILDHDRARQAFREIGYDGTNVKQYQDATNKLMNALYERMVKDAVAKGKRSIVFMSGVPGSGKSTFIKIQQKEAMDKFGVIYDAAFSTYYQLDAVIENAKKREMRVFRVVAVYKDIQTAFENTISRGIETGRFVELSYLIKTFLQNKNKIKELREKHPEVRILAIDNSNNQMQILEDPADAEDWNYDISEPTLYNLFQQLEDVITHGQINKQQAKALCTDLSKVDKMGSQRVTDAYNRIVEAYKKMDTTTNTNNNNGQGVKPAQPAQQGQRQAPAQAPTAPPQPAETRQPGKSELPAYEEAIHSDEYVKIDAEWKRPLLLELDKQLENAKNSTQANKILQKMHGILESKNQADYEQNNNARENEVQAELTNYEKIANQINNLIDSNVISASEIRHVAEQVVNSISDLITDIQKEKGLAERLFDTKKFKEDFDFQTASRREIINAIGVTTLLYRAKLLFSPRTLGLKNKNDVAQAKLIQKNWDAIMVLAADTFALNEGFGIGMNYETGEFETMDNTMPINVDAFNDFQDIEDIEENVGDEQEHWMIESRTIDIVSSMSELVRRAIHQCYILDKDFKPVTSKWGIKERVSPRKAVQSILKWTLGAQDLPHMIQMLENKMQDNQWVKQIVDRLKDESGKETDFQSQFYGVMTKSFQLYSIVVYEDGKYVSKIVNRHPALAEAIESVKAQFRIKEHVLLSGGINEELLGSKETTGKNHPSNLWQIRTALQTFQDHINRGEELTEDDIKEAAAYISAASRILGYFITEEMALQVLHDQTEVEENGGVLTTKGMSSLKQMTNALFYLTKNLTQQLEAQKKANNKESVINSYDPFKFKGTNSIITELSKFFAPIADVLEDTNISSFYDSGKMYQSYVTPSFTTRLFEKFHLTGEQFETFIKENYAFSEWFKYPDNDPDHPGEWRNELIRMLVESPRAREIFDHKVELNFNKRNFMRNMTNAEYALSLITEYHSVPDTGKESMVPAWYKIPMESNKPSSEFIKFYSYRGADYKDKIVAHMYDMALQELDRIRTVKIRNRKKGKEGHIKNWDDKGLQFNFLPVLNNYLLKDVESLEDKKAAARKLNKYLFEKDAEGDDVLSEAKAEKLVELLHKKVLGEEALTSDDMQKLKELVSEVVKNHMQERANEILEGWEKAGILKAAEKIEGIITDKNLKKESDIENAVREKLENFIWNNNWMAKNILQLTLGDVSFYKDAEDLQKRLAELHAPGIRANIWARDYVTGERVSDGVYRTVILEDFDTFVSNIVDNLNVVFDRKIEEAEKANDKHAKDYWTQLKYDLLRPRTYNEDGSVKDQGGSYWNINVADAQGYSSPSSYRKKALMFGKWSKKAEEIYQKLKRGEFNLTDLETAFQPLKPFVYGHIHKHVSDIGPIKNMPSPFQAKNAEYLLVMADALLQGQDTGKPNLLRAIYRVMEESEEVNPTRGIDTIQFASAIKSSYQRGINIHQFVNMPGGEEAAYTFLKSKIYKKATPSAAQPSRGLAGTALEQTKGDRRQGATSDAFRQGSNERKISSIDETLTSEYDTDNYVQELSYENYCLQQEVPAHFKNHSQAHGSQERMIVPSDLEMYVDPNAPEEIRNNPENIMEYSFVKPDGSGDVVKMNAKEIREEYERTIGDNISASIETLKEIFQISPSATKREQNLALSKLLQREILSSPRYGVDLIQACSIDAKTGEFRMPKGDPVQAKRIEQLINSIIKNRVNKQKIAGGPIVQVSNFGVSKELHIRFVDKQGNILLTKDEFIKKLGLKTETEEQRKAADQAFDDYIHANQAGIAHFEVLLPAWMKELYHLFADPQTGMIDIDALEIVCPELLKMISYRIPTEDKYSMAPMKAVGFLPKEAGDAVMLPQELTEIDDSDFDVDKRYFMRQEIDIAARYQLSEGKNATEAERDYVKHNKTSILDHIISTVKPPSKIYASDRKAFEKIAEEEEKNAAFKRKNAQKEHERKLEELESQMALYDDAYEKAKNATDWKERVNLNDLEKQKEKAESKYERNVEKENERYQARLDKIEQEKKDKITERENKYLKNVVKEKLKDKIEQFLSVDRWMPASNDDATTRAIRTAYLKYMFHPVYPPEAAGEAGRGYRNNKILNITWGILTNEKTAVQILNPGGFARPKKMGYMVAAFKNPANNYTWEELQKMDVDALKDLCYQDKDLTWVDTEIQFYKQNAAAASLIGVAAVNKVAHATLEGNGYELAVDEVCHLHDFTIGSTKFTEYMEVDPTTDANNTLIGKILGSLVSASADAVKDPVLNLMNVNMTTVGVMMTMVRLGVPFEEAALLLSQDIVTEVLNDFTKANITGYKTIDAVIKEKIKALEKDTGLSDKSKAYTEDLTTEEMIEGLQPRKEGLEGKALADRQKLEYKALLAFQRMRSLANEMRNITFSTRFNSISCSVGPLIIDNLILENKMDNFTYSPDNATHFYKHVEGKVDPVPVDIETVHKDHHILGQFARVVKEVAYPMFLDMPAGSLGFRKMLNTMKKGTRDKLFRNKQLLSKFSDFYQSYLLIQNGVVNEKHVMKMLNDFPKYFMNHKFGKLTIKDIYKDNILIQDIKMKTSKNSDRASLYINITGMEETDKEKYRSAWIELHKVNPGLSKMLFTYCFFKGGIGFSPKTFMALIPVFVKERLEGTNRKGEKKTYVETYRNAPTVIYDLVVDQFVRNNWDDNALVPMKSLDNTHYVIDYAKGTLETRDRTDLEDLQNHEYIKTRGNGETHLWKKEAGSKNDGYIKYKKIKPLGENGEYLHMSISALDNPGVTTTQLKTREDAAEQMEQSPMESEAEAPVENTKTEEQVMRDALDKMDGLEKMLYKHLSVKIQGYTPSMAVDRAAEIRKSIYEGTAKREFGTFLQKMWKAQLGVDLDVDKVIEEVNKLC